MTAWLRSSDISIARSVNIHQDLWRMNEWHEWCKNTLPILIYFKPMRSRPGHTHWPPTFSQYTPKYVTHEWMTWMMQKHITNINLLYANEVKARSHTLTSNIYTRGPLYEWWKIILSILLWTHMVAKYGTDKT
jgi:hypothetical protein